MQWAVCAPAGVNKYMPQNWWCCCSRDWRREEEKQEGGGVSRLRGRRGDKDTQRQSETDCCCQPPLRPSRSHLPALLPLWMDWVSFRSGFLHSPWVIGGRRWRTGLRCFLFPPFIPSPLLPAGKRLQGCRGIMQLWCEGKAQKVNRHRHLIICCYGVSSTNLIESTARGCLFI